MRQMVTSKSYKAYIKVCKILGVKPVPEKDITYPENIEDASLVIVPDKVFTWAKIKKLAIEFGKDQPNKAFIYEKLYKLYSAEELSGKPTGGKIRVLQIPHKLNAKHGTIKEQLAEHKGQHVPSVLEAVASWYTLREEGIQLNFDKTYIRHFDLPEQRIGDWLYVPYSYLDDDGRPGLYFSCAVDGSYGRLAVGENLNLVAPLEPSDNTVDSNATIEANTEAIVELNKTLKKVFKL